MTGLTEFEAIRSGTRCDPPGLHYRDETIRQLVTGFDDESILESTAAQVGGLARVADPLVKTIRDGLAGGDFMADERHSREMSKWLTTVGHLLTFVDHLFDVLLGRVPDSIVSTSHAVIDVPIGVQQARAAVERDRMRAAGSSEPSAQ